MENGCGQVWGDWSNDRDEEVMEGTLIAGIGRKGRVIRRDRAGSR